MARSHSANGVGLQVGAVVTGSAWVPNRLHTCPILCWASMDLEGIYGGILADLLN